MASSQQRETPTSHDGQAGINPADHYTIGWICALPIELAAAIKMLDEEHQRLPLPPGDDNSYRFGRIGDHNIVIGCLPSGRTGLVSASSVATQMMSAFRQIRVGLMVGIGGGVPSEDDDIRLGDIVVSHPNNQHGGVVQYDFGKTRSDGIFERTGSLNSPPKALLTVLTDVRAAAEEVDGLKIGDYLSRLTERLPLYAYPSKLTDRLYHPQYMHVGGKNCSRCDSEKSMDREERDTNAPRIHYGTIASGNRVMKDAIERDKISQDMGGVLCFEMEAAGLMNDFPCLAIRGISDYSDSHKNDGWQRYAAATAAAFAKELLCHLASTKINQIDPISQAMNQMASGLNKNSEMVERTNQEIGRANEREILEWLSSSLKLSKIQNLTRDCRVNGTGDWFVQDTRYITWFQAGGLIWLHGVAGCGKTVLSSKIIDDLTERCNPLPNSRIAYWYFQFSDSSTQDISNMLRSILRQLISSALPDQIHRLWSQHFRNQTEPSRAELLKVISVLVKRHEVVYLVLDALDEFPADKPPGRLTLLETIKDLMISCAPSLRCLVTSRREPDIRKSFQTVASCVIDIDPAIKEDVAKLVAFALQQDSMRRWGDIMATLIVPKLLGAEERRFRWTDLQIKRLSACPTEGDLLTALDTLPETLDEAYHQALATIPNTLQKRVRKILIWLTSSSREMTSREIAAVVSFPFVDDVLRICTSLLVTVIDDDTHETIKLAHFTVKEFLIVQQAYDETFYWYKFTAQLAHCCISEQIIPCIFPSSTSLPKALRPYAEVFWLAHARQNDATTDWAETQLLVDCILKHDNILFQDWLRAHHPLEACAQSPLYYASLLGLKASVMNLWRNIFPCGNEIEIIGSIVTTAARMGHVDIVRWLVEQRQDATNYIDFPRVVEYLQVNIREILCNLLRKGPKISLSAEAIYAATKNTSGDVILEVLLDEDLVTLAITEDIVEAAAHNRWNPLAQEQSVYTFRKLIFQGVKFPITPVLIESVAGSPCGSEILELLLDHCELARPLTKREVYAGASCFDLRISIKLLALQWDEDIVANDVVRHIAYNCHLEPAKRTKDSKRALDVHRDYRPTLKLPDAETRSKALKLVLVKAGRRLCFSESFFRTVANRFQITTFLHVLDHFMGKPIFAQATRHMTVLSPSDFMVCIAAQTFDLGVTEKHLKFLNSLWQPRRLRSDSLGNDESCSDKMVEDLCRPEAATVHKAHMGALPCEQIPELLSEFRRTVVASRAGIRVEEEQGGKALFRDDTTRGVVQDQSKPSSVAQFWYEKSCYHVLVMSFCLPILVLLVGSRYLDSLTALDSSALSAAFARLM
ncbi:hypothetical protein D6D21_03486 [Aureobasidium pullulans]|uniref:NACHT domain-containing protein n=1 Tax=Aureobasidium pullulans TaxID=5580 RepID=A0AB74J2N5_AURPU|nr:hypothetical protein D6D21_03486 [Aureobasidium pullulans]